MCNVGVGVCGSRRPGAPQLAGGGSGRGRLWRPGLAWWAQLERRLIQAPSKAGWGYGGEGGLRVCTLGSARRRRQAAYGTAAAGVPGGPQPTCSAGILADKASFRLVVLRVRRPAKQGGRGREPLTLGRPNPAGACQAAICRAHGTHLRRQGRCHKPPAGCTAARPASWRPAASWGSRLPAPRKEDRRGAEQGMGVGLG